MSENEDLIAIGTLYVSKHGQLYVLTKYSVNIYSNDLQYVFVLISNPNRIDSSISARKWILPTNIRDSNILNGVFYYLKEHSVRK